MELAAIFTATPAEIDTEIARIEDQAADAYARLKFTRQDIAEYDKAQSEGRSYFGRSIEILNDRRDKALADMAAAREARLPLDAEYIERGGWTRYFVVDNNNGHLHTTTGCQNTYVTTSWVWMTSMSGMTRAEAVAEGGKLTCLSCFPDFREEIESGREPRFETPRMKATREEREAAAAKKAEKAAKAAANAITNPDGTPLKTRSYGEIKTERTAWIEAVGELTWAEYSEYMIKSSPKYLEGEELAKQITWSRKQIKDHTETCAYIAQALAHKTGRDLADVMNEIVKKADAKIRKAQRERIVEEQRLAEMN